MFRWIEHMTIWATRGGSGGSSFLHPAEYPHCTAHFVPWRPSLGSPLTAAASIFPGSHQSWYLGFQASSLQTYPASNGFPSYAPTQLTYDNLQLRSHTANLFYSFHYHLRWLPGTHTVLFLFDQSGRYLVCLWHQAQSDTRLVFLRLIAHFLTITTVKKNSSPSLPSKVFSQPKQRLIS